MSEPEIISAEKARQAIEQKIVETLGEHWEQDWISVHQSDYLVRLNKNETNMDFQCDLLGNVEVQERMANPLQTSGRFLAWTILVASLAVAIAIAIAAGVFR
jgi:hypothetical protein